MSMELLNLILIETFTAIFVMTIWFKTEAFVEYISLLKLDKLFKVKEFIEYKKVNSDIDYPTFLLIKHKNFLTKLISCPFCLNFWIVLAMCVIFNTIFYLPVIYVLSINVYILLERKLYL